MKLDILKEIFGFVLENRKWWLGTILFLLVALGFVVVLTEGSALAPFIYALF